MSSKSAKRHQQKSAQKSAAPARQYTPAPKAPPVVKKQRGGWLTAMIVIMAVHGVFNTIALLSFRDTGKWATVPPWLLAAALFDGLATVAAAVGLWYWKRWSLYLYLAATAASIAVGLFVYPSMIAVFYNLVPVLILVYILTGQKKMALLA